MVQLLSLIVFSTQLWAFPEFNNLRIDNTVPEKCQEMDMSFYQLPMEYFYVGRDGALGMGFTFEYPIKRSDATLLWRYFKKAAAGTHDIDLFKKIKQKPHLKEDFDIINSTYVEQGYDFSNEGEILESLAIHKLYQEFPSNEYFITGGIEYREAGGPTIGELDIYVARKDNCESVALGETKLGKKKTLNKAKEQIQRFGSFLRDNHAPAFSREYEPQEFENGDMRFSTSEIISASQKAL